MASVSKMITLASRFGRRLAREASFSRTLKDRVPLLRYTTDRMADELVVDSRGGVFLQSTHVQAVRCSLLVVRRTRPESAPAALTDGSVGVVLAGQGEGWATTIRH